MNMEQHHEPSQNAEEQRGPVEQLEVTIGRQLISLGITDALSEDRAIDHATARFIAEQSVGRQGSALRVLASSGEVARTLGTELDVWRTQAPVELEPWIDALDEYRQIRSDPRPVTGWHYLWPTALNKRLPTAQVGSTSELGWFGLYRHGDQSGGFIFTVDELGCHTFTETTSDHELTRRWIRIRGEYAYFYRVRSIADDRTPE